MADKLHGAMMNGGINYVTDYSKRGQPAWAAVRVLHF